MGGVCSCKMDKVREHRAEWHEEGADGKHVEEGTKEPSVRARKDTARLVSVKTKGKQFMVYLVQERLLSREEPP